MRLNIVDKIVSCVSILLCVWHKLQVNFGPMYDFYMKKNRMVILPVSDDNITTEFRELEITYYDTTLYHYFKNESSYDFLKTLKNIGLPCYYTPGDKTYVFKCIDGDIAFVDLNKFDFR